MCEGQSLSILKHCWSGVTLTPESALPLPFSLGLGADSCGWLLTNRGGLIPKRSSGAVQLRGRRAEVSPLLLCKPQIKKPCDCLSKLSTCETSGQVSAHPAETGTPAKVHSFSSCELKGYAHIGVGLGPESKLSPYHPQWVQIHNSCNPRN